MGCCWKWLGSGVTEEICLIHAVPMSRESHSGQQGCDLALHGSAPHLPSLTLPTKILTPMLRSLTPTPSIYTSMVLILSGFAGQRWLLQVPGLSLLMSWGSLKTGGSLSSGFSSSFLVTQGIGVHRRWRQGDHKLEGSPSNLVKLYIKQASPITACHLAQLGTLPRTVWGLAPSCGSRSPHTDLLSPSRQKPDWEGPLGTSVL